MRTKLIKITLAASILLAYAFTTSCSMLEENDDSSSSSGTGSGSSPSSNPGSSSSGGSSGFNLNSQIYSMVWDWDEETDDEVYIVTSIADNGSVEESVLEKIGTVTRGKVTNLELLTKRIPDDELSSYAFSIDEDEIEEFCSIYTHDNQGYWANFSLLDTDGDYAGELVIESKSGAYEKLQYLYSPKAGKINCNIDYGYSSYQYDLDLKAGWNEIYIKEVSEDYYYSETKYSTSKTILNTELAWRIYYPWW